MTPLGLTPLGRSRHGLRDNTGSIGDDRVRRAGTIVDVLFERANSGDDGGFVFLPDGEVPGPSLSWEDLSSRVLSVSSGIRGHCAAGDRALLFFRPGLDFLSAFLGCLHAGVVAVPCVPPSRPVRRSFERINEVARVARASLVLSPAQVRMTAEELTEHAPLLSGCPVLDPSTLPPAREHAPSRAQPGGTAFLQFTSGSTSAPRGVIVTHASLMNNLGYIHECFGHNKDSIAITWLPVFHDMGLVDGMLEPIYGGFRCYAMPPHAFLQRPLRWLRAISTYRATHSGGPNFAYELCVDKVTPAQTADLDLRSWRIAYNGAEPIRPSTMAAFGGAFGPCGFRSEAFHPCYGLAEATLKVTGGSATELHPCTVDAVALERGELVRVAPGAPRGRTIASCGTVFRDFELAIVNPESSQAVPEGNIGEIWLSGPSVARGYFGDDLATTEVFEARTADGRGPFLRTGDLGFVLDREVYVTGRLRDLIILAGRNLYPQDIERSAESASSTYVPGSVVAFSTDDGLREHLIVLVEAQRPFHSSEEPAALRVSLDAVRRAVARDNSVDAAVVAVVPMGTLLKTSSGKIRRRACRRAYLAGELPVLASLRHEEALGPA